MSSEIEQPPEMDPNERSEKKLPGPSQDRSLGIISGIFGVMALLSTTFQPFWAIVLGPVAIATGNLCMARCKVGRAAGSGNGKVGMILGIIGAILGTVLLIMAQVN